MTADSEVMPDDVNMTQDPYLFGDPQGDVENADVSTAPEAEGQGGPGALLEEPGEAPLDHDLLYDEEEDQPLNAEEATILVLHFLQRMRKRIITPRKAVLNDENVFVVEVDLKEAKATIHINAETREIVEYIIEPIAKEPIPLPIPIRRLAIGLAGALSLLVVYVFQKPVLDALSPILSVITSDHLIIGGAVLIAAGVVVWWRRRG
ncbi:hypothetical protein E2P65_02650 [Candidatus Bathyarchaeota archaeon]|nr:hypothetical protein E2P65_02650 [Candidatus Bathyarchaeota archaeon]